MIKYFVGIMLIAQVALGDTCYPSPPIQLNDSQGRPLVGAQASILDDSGLLIVPFADKDCQIPFSGILPPSGILQFFYYPGVFQVNVSGSGTILQFKERIPGGTTATRQCTSLRHPGRTIAMTRPPNHQDNREVGLFWINRRTKHIYVSMGHGVWVLIK